jgi:hypothetical protein
MKRCPTCNQTFEEDWLSFCTQDGTTLVDDSTSYSEPPPTILASQSPSQSDQATLNLPSSGGLNPAWQTPSVSPAWKPPPPPNYVQPINKSLATAAMIIGILSLAVGWICLGPIPGVVAIILGAVALSQIKKSPDRIGGRQQAWIGIATGGLTVLIYAGIMIFYVIVAIVANS